MLDDVFYVGVLSFLVFFISDAYMAYLLHQLKRAHPAIDECSPQGAFNVNPTVFMSANARSTEGHGEEFDEEEATSRRATSSFSGFLPNFGIARPADVVALVRSDRQKLFQVLVVIASIFAPLFCFLQVVAFPQMQWSLFATPDWLGVLTVLPGLGVSVFYAMRAHRLSKVYEVTKGQWLTAMWFRLDIVCLVATIMLLGWGDWLVAACLYTMDLYLAQHLLSTERRLVQSAANASLIARSEEGAAEQQ